MTPKEKRFAELRNNVVEALKNVLTLQSEIGILDPIEAQKMFELFAVTKKNMLTIAMRLNYLELGKEWESESRKGSNQGFDSSTSSTGRTA